MALTEFDIIDRYFKRTIVDPARVSLGVGDDAAILALPPGEALVTSIDTLNVGVHFVESVDPRDLGYKSLAVSLSDIAAMGATPFSALLALSLPTVDDRWLSEFSQGFFELADQYQVALVGGDTTQGALSISSVVNGYVQKNQALCCHHAKVGDGVYVTGSLGGAGLALRQVLAKQTVAPNLLMRLNRPSPRVQVGLALRGLANGVKDISDGLLADLTKVCLASGVGAVIAANEIPIMNELGSLDPQDALMLALSAGDDYELVFTAPKVHHDRVLESGHGVGIHKIGEIVAGSDVVICDNLGQPIIFDSFGYEHFK